MDLRRGEGVVGTELLSLNVEGMVTDIVEVNNAKALLILDKGILIWCRIEVAEITSCFFSAGSFTGLISTHGAGSFQIWDQNLRIRCRKE